MIVSGVGGSTSLPMTLPGYTTSSSNSTVPSLKSKSTSDSTTTATDGSGEAKFPSEQRTKGAESAREAKKKEEEPKPKPLPPLKGLTVSEIRAMLGVAPLPGQEVRPGSVAGIGMAALNTTQSVSTAFLRQNRYSQYQYA